MKGIQVFSNPEFGNLRAFASDGEIWFVAKDPCEVLGTATGDVRRILDEDEISTLSQVGANMDTMHIGPEQGGRDPLVISEAGFYKLVMKSRKPEAKPFQRWVTHEVLPSIRKTGGYIAGQEQMTPEQVVANALVVAQNIIKQREARIEQLAPKAAFADEVLDSEGTYTVTEAARLLKQVDKDMSRNRLFALLRADEMIEKNSNKATAKAVERGYLYNYIPEAYEDPLTGEKKLRKPYARVKAKGLSWMTGRYCKGQQSLMIEVA